MQLDPISTGIRPARWRLAGEKEAHMISTDFETRQLLAREHRDQLARDMQLARRPQPERSSFLAARRVLRRAHDSIRAHQEVEAEAIAAPTSERTLLQQTARFLKLRPEV
jgi:hypothetical protein